MGDIMVELTTWPSHRHVFYKMTACGLLFEVKGAANAAIGLAKKPGNLCDVWVVIGHDQRTWIKKQGDSGNTVRTPNILNNGEYRRFWLSWRGGVVELGRSYDRAPIVAHPVNMELCYVTFSSWSGNVIDWTPIQWRFEMPPILEKPQMQSVTNGELVWVQADNHLPDGALIGGYEDETLYIIRANHQGSLTPGKFVPSEGTGYISWGGNAHDKHFFEVLCGFDCTWVSSFEDRIPVGAVEGGYSEGRNREKLYVGRAVYFGCLIPGKVQPSHKVCYIPYEEREIPVKKYEILVSPNLTARCANRLYIDHIESESPPVSENGDVEGPEELFHEEGSEEEN